MHIPPRLKKEQIMTQEELMKARRDSMNHMAQEAYLQVKENIDTAQNDNTPYAAVIGDDIVVNGDPNETVVTKKDYTAQFLIPEHEIQKYPGAKPIGRGYALLELEYKDVFPSARRNLEFTSAAARLMPFYRKMDDLGNIEELKEEEAIEFFAAFDKDIIRALYELVQVVLDVDDELMEYMAPSCALHLAVNITKDFPSVINQGDLFFG